MEASKATNNFRRNNELGEEINLTQKETTPEKTKRLEGTRGVKWAYFFMIIHALALFSICCENFADGLGVFLSRFGQNFISLNFGDIILLVAYLTSFNFICISAIAIALIALFRYKNKEAKYTVVLGIVLFVVTYPYEP